MLSFLYYLTLSDYVQCVIYNVHVLCVYRNPEQCPNVVSLLAESFNPHVRCGASWALGIACAASGNKVSVWLIHNLSVVLYSLLYMQGILGLPN